MAVYRKVNLSFWEDTKIVDEFTPEDRYFMLYLMTNPHTNQAGCYQITVRQMEFETGYTKDTIYKLLNRLTNILNVIRYDEKTKELFIKNWYKYNWTSSPKVMACILKEAETIKNKEFRYSIDTLLIQYGYSIDTETQEEKEEKEKEEKEEEEENKLTTTSDEFLSSYKEICTNLPQIRELSSSRRNKIKARLKDTPIETWKEVFKKMNESDFCCGKNDRKWTATFDWIISNDTNYLKVLEGKYDNKNKQKEISYEEAKKTWNPYA